MDPREGEHKDWGTLIFNFGRHEVKNFLVSNALFWLEKFHIDGLRVDAVASMLYRNYSRRDGEWIPNKYGGIENQEAVVLLQTMNTLVHEKFPGAVTIAEESTAWPMVSRPTYSGGLGFTFKWNMGWMNDILSYFSKDPIHRKYHQNQITFGLCYAFT
jgi:1,4-alpha-glucan branching enzyme